MKLVVRRKKNAVRYQLVLQFKGDALAENDQMASLWDALIEVLGDTADLDGHHAGSGQTNIFIFTPDPPATFAHVKPVLETRHYLGALTAAYRPVNSEHFTVIWPEGRK